MDSILFAVKVVLIVIALGYVAYSWIYMKDAVKTEHYIGITVPPMIKTSIKLDILASLFVAVSTLFLLIFEIQ